MKYSSILVVTYGRTGSTLLQGILNSIDGCVVRGENYNFCVGLYEAYLSLTRTKAEFGAAPSKEPASPWFGAYLFDENQFLKDARLMVANQLKAAQGGRAADCVGFKEIRYIDSELELTKYARTFGVKGYLSFLEKLFPNPCLIVLTRDHEQIARSAWWRDMPRGEIDRLLGAFEGAMQEYTEGRGNTFWISYGDMVETTENLQRLYDFLGVAYDGDRVAQVLATTHSFPTDRVSGTPE